MHCALLPSNYSADEILFENISAETGTLRNLKKTNLEHRDAFFEGREAVLREKNICAPSKLREERV
jgi:hypothetical protein